MIVDTTHPPDPDVLARAAIRFGRAGAPDAYLASGMAIALVAVDGDDILGWAYGYVLPRPDGATMAYLHDLDVAEAVRRRGHGAALLDAFLDAARARGAAKAFLITAHDNVAARALYASRGGVPSAGGDPATYWFPLDG